MVSRSAFFSSVASTRARHVRGEQEHEVVLRRAGGPRQLLRHLAAAMHEVAPDDGVRERIIEVELHRVR